MYDIEAMILVQFGEPSLRHELFDININKDSLSVELDLINEFRDKSRTREEACKIRAAKRYNSKVVARSFQKGEFDLANAQ